MASTRPRRERPPLDRDTLDELALAYVARFATTRARLGDYLRRKLRERGWAGDEDAPVAMLVERLAGAGFVDDAAFAVAKARALTDRGYGGGRVRQSLRAAGVGEADSGPATRLARAGAVEAAIRFARRRRLGPFAAAVPDRRERERAIAALLRAGHDFALSRAIVDLAPGAQADPAELAAAAGVVAVTD